MKEKYSGLRLYLLLPYHPAEQPVDMPPGYDGTCYPEGMETASRRYAIAKANRKMIDSCDFLITYVIHTASNAHRFMEYALRRQEKGLLRVINLGAGENDPLPPA